MICGFNLTLEESSVWSMAMNALIFGLDSARVFDLHHGSMLSFQLDVDLLIMAASCHNFGTSDVATERLFTVCKLAQHIQISLIM